MAYRPTTFDPNKAFAWSYSKLKNFESCPKRHYHVDVVKTHTEGESEQLVWGNRIHDALARAIGNVGGKRPDGSDALPLPETMAEYLPLVNARRARRAVPGAVVATELSLAITSEFKPTEYFSKNAWYRCKVDVATVFQVGSVAVAVAEDWKTGKIVTDSPQLHMTALAVLAHYPAVQRVQATFEWLKEGSKTTENIDRAHAAAVWGAIAPRVEPLRVAYSTPDPEQGFPPQPGYLCRRWCPVKSCRYHGT